FTHFDVRHELEPVDEHLPDHRLTLLERRGRRKRGRDVVPLGLHPTTHAKYVKGRLGIRVLHERERGRINRGETPRCSADARALASALVRLDRDNVKGRCLRGDRDDEEKRNEQTTHLAPSGGQAKTRATNGVYNRRHVHIEALIDRTGGRPAVHYGVARRIGRGSTKARSAAERPSNSSRLSDSHRSASEEPRAGQLARDSAYVRWLGLQPARPDHDRKRQ